MNKIIKEIKKELIKIDGQLKKIDILLESAPDGYLNYKIVNNRVYYYHQLIGRAKKIKSTKTITTNKNTNTINSNNRVVNNITSNINYSCKQKYIKKSEIELAKILAQKAYYLVIKPILEKQYKQLTMFLENYKPEETQKIYDELNNIRKGIVTPIIISKEERIRQWNQEGYKANDYFNENKKYETDQGEFVRSKSEMIIANMLYKYRKDILYKYERPLDILVNGIVHTVYPDFTILNIHTGKITYLEHAGCMDNPNYANDFIKKTNNYIMNNIVPGVDLITTYESRDCPLDIKIVKRMIEDLI